MPTELVSQYAYVRCFWHSWYYQSWVVVFETEGWYQVETKDELFIIEGKNIKVEKLKLVFGYYASMGFKSLLMCLINDFLHLIYMLILTKCNI